MTARYSWAVVLKELAGAQSTLTRADVRYGRSGDDWHDAMVRKARAAIADAQRVVRALRHRSRRAAVNLLRHVAEHVSGFRRLGRR